MPLSFNEVYDLYRNVAPKGMALQQFAQKANTLFGNQDFSEGQRGLPGRLAGQANYWIDQSIPEDWKQATGDFGSAAFDFLGANPELGREVGREIPKTVATWLPALATAPFSATAGAIGLGTTAALSGLESYGESGSAVHGATSAAAPYVGGYVGSKVGELGLDVVKKLPWLKALGLEGGRLIEGLGEAGEPVINRVAQTVPDRIVKYLGGQVGGLGAMEGTSRLGSALAGEEQPEFNLKDFVAQAAIGNLPFMALDLPHLFKPSVVSQKPAPFKPESQQELVQDPIELERAASDAQFAQQMARANFIKDPRQKAQAVQAIKDRRMVQNFDIDVKAGKFQLPSEPFSLWGDQPPNIVPGTGINPPSGAFSIWTEDNHPLNNPTIPPSEAFTLWTQQNAQANPQKRYQHIPWTGAPPAIGTQITHDGALWKVNGITPDGTEVSLFGPLGTPVSIPSKAFTLWTREQKQEALESVVVPPASAVTPETVPAVLGQAAQLSKENGAELDLETVRQMAEMLNEGGIAPPDEALQRATVGKLNEEKVKAQRVVTTKAQELHTAFADVAKLAKTPEELAEVKAVQDGFKSHQPKEGETKELTTAILSKWRAWKQEGSGDLQKLKDSFKSINLLPDTAGPSVRGPEGRAAKFKDRAEADALAVKLTQENKDPNITGFASRLIRGKFEVKPNYKTLELRKRAYAEQADRATKVVKAAVPDLRPKDEIEKLGAKAVYDNFDEWYKQFVDPYGDDLVDVGVKLAPGLVTPETAKEARKSFTNNPPTEAQKRAFAEAIWDHLVPKKAKAKKGKSVEDKELALLDKKEAKAAAVDPDLEVLDDAAHIDKDFNGETDPDEMQQMMENYSPEEGLKFAQIKLKAGNGFNWSLPEVGKVGDNWMLGKKNFGKAGVINVEALKSAGLKNAEIDLYKQIVPEAFTEHGFVSLEKLVAGLEKNGPVVEEKKLGNTGATSRAQIAEHELSTLGYGLVFYPREGVYGVEKNGKRVIDLPERDAQLLKDYNDSQNEADSQGNFTYVAPKAESEMPGYVEGLVRVPTAIAERPRQPGESFSLGSNKPLYSGPHFGSEDTNVVSFYRGYEETLPDGKKVFHVIEVQSDWAQRQRELKERIKSGDPNSPYQTVNRSQERADLARIDHPLLSAYESLALKAAIKHAQEIGADYIALSDAETAMMSEGHDQDLTASGVGKTKEEALSNLPNKDLIIDGSIHYEPNESHPVGWRAIASYKPSQEAGMRLHYDRTLPSELKRLTGGEGEVVDFGRHDKGRQEPKVIKERLTKDQAESLIQTQRVEEPAAEYYAAPMSDGSGYWFVADRRLSGSPVFRNAEGQPKSNITARLYSLDKLASEPFAKRNQELLAAQLTPAERLKMQKMRQGMTPIPGTEGLKENPAFYHLPTMSSAEAILTDGQHFGIEGPVYYFNRIVSGVEGKGGGSNVLDQLLAYADKHNIPIVNEPSATGQLDKTQLPEWYRRKGFVQQGLATGDNRLIYWPGTRAALGMKNELIPSLSNLWGRVARASGESQETIAAMMPFFNAMEKLLPLDNKSFGLLMNDVAMKSGYIYGAADNASRDRGRFLLAPFYGGADKVSTIRDATIFALHEAGHAIEPFLKNTPAYNQLREFIARGGQELEDGMAFLHDHLIGDAKNSESIKELLASRDPDELSANIVGLGWALPRLSKEQQRSLALLGPQPIRSIYQKILDFGHRFFSYIKAAMFGKQVKMTDGAKTILEIQKQLDAAQKEMKRADQDLTDTARFQDANENLWDDARTSQFTQEDTELRFAQIIGKDKEQSGFGKFFRNWFSLLHSHAQRNPEIAAPVSFLYDHPTRMTQLHNDALFSIYGQIDPNSGVVIKDKSKIKDRNRVTQGADSRTNKLISDIWTWNQDPDRVATVVTEAKLAQASDPKGKELYRRLMQAPQEAREALKNYTAGAHLSIKQIQDHLIRATSDVEAPMHIAAYISSALPDRFMQAPKDAQMLLEGQRNALSADPRAQLLGQQQLATARAQLGDETFQRSLELAAASENKVEDLKSFLQGGFSRRLGRDLPGRAGFFSRMRSGEQLMTVTLPNGKSPVKAEPVPAGAEAAWVKMQEAKYGQNIVVRVEKSHHGMRQLQLPDGLNEMLKEHQDKQVAILTAAGVDPNVIQQITEAGDVAAELKINELMAKQAVVPGSRSLAPAELDMVAVHDAFMGYMARRTADIELNARIAYGLANPALKERPELVQHFRQALQQYKTPDSKFGRALATGNFFYYMAGAIPTHINNATQSWMTLSPELVARGLSPWKATQLTTSAAKDVAKFTWKLAAAGVKRRLGLSDEYAQWGDKDEAKQLKRFVEEGNVGFGTFDEIRNNQVDAAADLTYIGKKGRVATAMEKAVSPVRALGSLSLKAYATTEHFNVRTAFISGLRLAKQKGLTASEAYEFAKDVVRSSTYQGGRAGRPVAPFEGQHKLVGHLAYGLQTYTLGWLGQLATHVSRWRSADLGPAERKAARSAAMTQLGLQFAAAGALGMPFFGAATVLLEKVLGVDLRGRMYQSLSGLLDQDQEDGGGLADIAMKGGANSLLASVGLPLDFGSRFAIGGVVGMNEYDGWQPNAVFGPTAGVVSNVLAGLKGAYDGDWGKAAKEFSPAAIRKGVDYLQNGGQVLDSNGSPVPATDTEGLGYALGFVPTRLSKLRQFQSYERARHLEEANKYAQTVAQLSDLVLDAPEQATVEFQKALSQQAGTKTASELASDVASKVAAKTFPTDVRAGLDRSSSSYMMDVAKGIGLQAPAANQMERLQLKQHIMQLLGVGRRFSRPLMQRAQRADLLGDELSPFPTRRPLHGRSQGSSLF